jgi:hypothetical protein
VIKVTKVNVAALLLGIGVAGFMLFMLYTGIRWIPVHAMVLMGILSGD